MLKLEPNHEIYDPTDDEITDFKLERIIMFKSATNWYFQTKTKENSYVTKSIYVEYDSSL